MSLAWHLSQVTNTVQQESYLIEYKKPTLSIQLARLIVSILTSKVPIRIFEMLRPEAIWNAESGQRQIATGLAALDGAC
jgi:hypothetical protein